MVRFLGGMVGRAVVQGVGAGGGSAAAAPAADEGAAVTAYAKLRPRTSEWGHRVERGKGRTNENVGWSNAEAVRVRG